MNGVVALRDQINCTMDDIVLYTLDGNATLALDYINILRIQVNRVENQLAEMSDKE